MIAGHELVSVDISPARFLASVDGVHGGDCMQQDVHHTVRSIYSHKIWASARADAGRPANRARRKWMAVLLVGVANFSSFLDHGIQRSTTDKQASKTTELRDRLDQVTRMHALASAAVQ
jgi:hypothetical protein